MCFAFIENGLEDVHGEADVLCGEGLALLLLALFSAGSGRLGLAVSDVPGDQHPHRAIPGQHRVSTTKLSDGWIVDTKCVLRIVADIVGINRRTLCNGPERMCGEPVLEKCGVPCDVTTRNEKIS
jgi:hypothetical protein